MTTRTARLGPSLARSVDPGVTDRDLLHRFAARQDEAAFEALVRRHGPMVLAAGRRVLGDVHAAEDVCQAAFLLLARKASSHRWQPSVANWLHRTAHLLALKARRAADRRVRREGRAAVRPPANPLAEMTGQELLAVLDAELLALPETLRGPLVLCYLEGATRDEAADRLGCELAALKKRLERGRERLHAALVRRGLGLPAVLLGVLVTQDAPAATAGQIAQAARAVAAGLPASGLVSPHVCELLDGGLGIMGRHSLKVALTVLLVGGLLAAAGAIAPLPNDEKPPQPVPKVEDSKPEPAAAKTLRVVVLDPEGKPVADAEVYASVWTEEKDFKSNREYKTDAEGAAQVALPKKFTILRVWAGKTPFVTMFANWEQAELAAGKDVPAAYTFRLEPGSTAGGVVVDEQGKPVAGAKVQARLSTSPKPPTGDGRVRYGGTFATAKEPVTTDVDGRWRIDGVPTHPEAELAIVATHPDFVSDDVFGQSAKASGVTTAKLRAGTAALTLKRGVVVRGTVTDPAGKPVTDAVVIHRYHSSNAFPTTNKFPTDAAGRYRLPALPTGPTAVTVLAAGWAPQMREVDLKDGLPAQDFRLAPGKPARLRIVDAAGRPVPKAGVIPLEWKGSRAITSMRAVDNVNLPDVGIPTQADADGVWHWAAAPDGAVKVLIIAKGYARQELEVTGGATDRTVTLKSEHRITGTVTDTVTGKPVPAFAVIPVNVFRKDFLSADRGHAVAGKNGRLDFLADRPDIPLRLRVEAPGYRTREGPEFRVGDDAGRTQDFRLQPSTPLTGVVCGPDGRPAAKAEVLLATPTEQADITHDENHRTFTDAAGRFTFPDPGEPWAVIARTDAGVASAEFPADRTDAGTLTLRPWAAVRGTFADGGQPVRGARVFLSPIRLGGLGRPRIEDTLQTLTDADGRFAFPRVPPGPVCVHVSIGPWKDEGFRSGPGVPLDLKPGEKADLALGSGGATVTGRVKLTGKVPADLDCTYSLNYLVRREPGIVPPSEVTAAGFDARTGWRDAWHQTDEGRAYLHTLRHWFVKLAPDGTFRVSGVPPGEYDLAVSVYAKPSGCLTDPLARRVVRVTVTDRAEQAVPEIAAEVVPIPAVGDVPALSFKRPDGTTGTLADGRGTYTVVHFWASWCGPCKKQLPALRALQAKFAARGLAVLSLSLDEGDAAWRAAVKGLDLPWPQGRVGADGVPGVSSVPAYWLLDPAGKIAAKAFDPDDFATVLADRLPHEHRPR